ncbi:hypothetical protein C8K30_102546 [Promicromonospora sp. AC04]|uniref:hypothetical protein n=1 Tax=Promicromonospora sp. AC04 TaxID=2135723 RepID=UPI000D45B764|nr:hypothetical protein [Promicromonospora sp. AC04]PUB30164.1 hypothetical protein C8K30_102546 [Promicromonospora sp. AC04]
MTRRDRETSSRGSLVWWRGRRGDDGESGQALAEYVAVVGLLLLVIAIVFVAAAPVGASEGEQLVCAVQQLGKENAPEDCVDEPGEEDDGDDEPGDDESPDDEYSPPTGDCEDDVTFDQANLDEEYLTPVVRIDCVWYTVRAICASSEIPDGWFDRDEDDRVYLEDEIVEFVDCVTDGYGAPKDDPDDESCVNTLPTSGEIDEDAPPKVQVGCKELPVPRGCEAEWAAYKDAPAGKERAGKSRDLANCMSETYSEIEPECVVSSTSHVDSENVSFLFVRWGASNGMLIEKLGDGRIRVHILKGVEQGGGISVDSTISFDVAGITGYSMDKTYEFTDMGKAQEWIDWYKDYNKVNGQQEGCTPSSEHWGDTCTETDEADELADEEPEHHELAEGEGESRKVSFTGGLSGAGGVGPAEIEGSVEGGYEGEVSAEETLYSDGSTTVSYTSTDIGGFLIGASIGGSKPFTNNKKCKNEDGSSKCDGSGSGSGQVGMEWTGTTQIEVNRHPDGSLYNVILRMDDQVLKTLAKAGVDIEATLPRGFSVGGGWEKSSQSGSASVREMILDFSQFPELEDELGPKIDELFPLDEDGRLETGDVDINASEYAEGGSLYDAIDDHANVRELEYDVDRTTESGHLGVDLQDVNLFEVEWTEVDEERDLKDSSYEVIDVNGDKQEVSPAPACKAKEFEEDEGYYADDFSDPPTELQNPEHDLGAEYFDNESPKYTEDGPYPGTDYDGDVPGDDADLTKSLMDEYAEAFPDTNILVVKDFENFSFSHAEGFEHLATVDGMDVIAIDKGTVENKGDGEYNNWRFKGNFDYDEEEKTVEFSPRESGGECLVDDPAVNLFNGESSDDPPLVNLAASGSGSGKGGPKSGHCGGQ